MGTRIRVAIACVKKPRCEFGIQTGKHPHDQPRAEILLCQSSDLWAAYLARVGFPSSKSIQRAIWPYRARS
jgi:hypothetical protein